MNSSPILLKDTVAGYIIVSDNLEQKLLAGPDIWCFKIQSLNTGGKVFSYTVDRIKRENQQIPLDTDWFPSLRKNQPVDTVGSSFAAGQLMYGVGIKNSEHEFGMIDGPHPDLNKMLSVVGAANSYILQLSGEPLSHVELYVWDENKVEWCDVTKLKTYTVKLTYFKRTGKYYTTGEYESPDKELFEIWDDVRVMLENGKRPGLKDGFGDDFIVHIEVPGHPSDHPKLIIPPRKD